MRYPALPSTIRYRLYLQSNDVYLDFSLSLSELTVVKFTSLIIKVTRFIKIHYWTMQPSCKLVSKTRESLLRPVVTIVPSSMDYLREISTQFSGLFPDLSLTKCRPFHFHA